jgi:hypothetical protein
MNVQISWRPPPSKILKKADNLGQGASFDFIQEGWLLPAGNPWNDGMVEKWNIGYE